jgi:hypothetical protein
MLKNTPLTLTLPPASGWRGGKYVNDLIAVAKSFHVLRNTTRHEKRAPK